MAVNPPLAGAQAVYDSPARTLNFGQVSAPTTAPVEVAGNNPRRLSLTVTNADSANFIAVGDSPGMTTGSGHIIPAGVSLTLTHWRGPLFAIAHTAAVVVTYLEEEA